MRLVRIKDSDGAGFDTFVIAPGDVSDERAVELVDEAVQVVKAISEEYNYADVFHWLEVIGFTVPDVLESTEVF